MRYYNWPEKMFAAIRAASQSKFEWGKNDCALFACDCILAMTGIDHAKDFRGNYDTRKSAMTALKNIEEVDDLSALADKFLGERIELKRARRGDLVLLTIGSMKALGIVTGTYATFLAPEGIQTILISDCFCAWRVQ